MLLLLFKPYVTSNSVYYRCPKISIICSEIQCYNYCYDNDIQFIYYPHGKQVGLDLFLTHRLMTYLFRVLIYMEPAGKWIILRCGWRQVVINKTIMFILFYPTVSIIIPICFYVLEPFRISCSWCLDRKCRRKRVRNNIGSMSSHKLLYFAAKWGPVCHIYIYIEI